MQCFVSTSTYSTLHSGYKFKLEIDYLKEKIYLLIFNKYNELIEKKIYWDFDDLIKMINKKLNILAIVNFKKQITNNITQFHYTKINYYNIKSSAVFFKLIEIGKIKINFDLGIYRSGPKIGKEHDNGVFFYIDNNNFFKLYNKIDF